VLQVYVSIAKTVFEQSKDFMLLSTKSSELILLSGVHLTCFRNNVDHTAKSKARTALDLINNGCFAFNCVRGQVPPHT
jgi:hypothetical protein